MTTSYLLSAVEPININVMSITAADEEDTANEYKYKMNSGSPANLTNLSNKISDSERNLTVRLDDRDLWLKFQNLTNEMIVTKNGR
jgi:hypothetical protein